MARSRFLVGHRFIKNSLFIALINKPSPIVKLFTPATLLTYLNIFLQILYTYISTTALHISAAKYKSSAMEHALFRERIVTETAAISASAVSHYQTPWRWYFAHVQFTVTSENRCGGWVSVEDTTITLNTI